MNTMNLLNVNVAPVRDNRIGQYSERVRPLHTPYGTFRSVAVAADHIMAHVPQFWVCYLGKRGMTVAKARALVYNRIYQRCLHNVYGWKFIGNPILYTYTKSAGRPRHDGVVNPVRTTSMTLAEIRAKLAALEAELKARGG